MLVARYVWRQNAAPTLVALRPHVSRKGAKECLYLQTLPFAEDLRDWPFDPLPTPSAAQSSAVDALIDAMDLMDAAPGAGGEALRPKRMPNPSIQRFHSCTLARARDPRAPVPGRGGAPATPRGSWPGHSRPLPEGGSAPLRRSARGSGATTSRSAS